MKNKILIFIFFLFLIFGIWFFGFEKQNFAEQNSAGENKERIFAEPKSAPQKDFEIEKKEERILICDEFGNKYQSEEEAKKAGLKDAQFGATYCQYFEEEEKEKNEKKKGEQEKEKEVLEIKLKPLKNKIYFGAFPDFGGSEDQVLSKKIKDFEKKAGHKIF
jgi:hypothetical protein